MLYATTRSKTDTYTAHRTLFEDRAPDGGFFVPFRMPNVDIQSLKENSFSEAVAEILNVFFSTGITAWDVDCCIGKSAAKYEAFAGYPGWWICSYGSDDRCRNYRSWWWFHCIY